jgi:hypothetical protein
MDIPNYVKESLFKDRGFIMEMTEASEKLFDSIQNTFFIGNDREVKILRSEDDTCIYVFDKRGQKLTVGWEKIEDFQKKKSTKELLHYTTIRLKEYEENPKKDDDGDLYLLTIHGSKRIEFLKQIENGTFKEEEKEDPVEKEIKRIRDLGMDLDEAFINKMRSFMTVAKQKPDAALKEQYEFKCSPHVDILKDYTKVLNNTGFLTTKLEDSFFKKLNTQGYSRRDQKLPDMWKTINYFTNVCKANDFLTYKQSFGYNDSDNSIFLHNDKLIVADQTCGYYFDIKDKDNYKVYFLEKEYKGLEKEIERTETELKNNTINELKSVTLEVRDGKTVFQNDVFAYVLDLCFEYGPDAMKEAGLKSRKPAKKKM